MAGAKLGGKRSPVAEERSTLAGEGSPPSKKPSPETEKRSCISLLLLANVGAGLPRDESGHEALPTCKPARSEPSDAGCALAAQQAVAGPARHLPGGRRLAAMRSAHH